MATGIEEMTLLPKEDDHALAPAPTQAESMVLMFERLATNPQVDVEKFERLMAMQERIMRHNAKAAFDGALARMQAELPEIVERGRIVVKGQQRSTYAKLEDIHAQVKPILNKHGFAVRHRTEWPADRAGIIRIVGILSHEQGHSEESVFEAPLDRSDYRTDIQSMGSTVSYGRRYTTLDLLNIATRSEDTDGQTHDPAKVAEAPKGYDQWLTDLAAVADNGWEDLRAAWEKSKLDYRKHLTSTNAPRWSEIQRIATRVTAKAKAAQS